MQRKVITSHLHARIRSLTQKALEQNLIVSCDRVSDAEHYRIEGTEEYLIVRCQGSQPMRCTAVFTGVFLLEVLK
ncbi:MAG: hypothetical protein J7525_19790 [Roseofilum sp. SID3]|uniref:hypothetical protein n=1 Tax=Roseofilum sp. SID3 TaxID=2821499 RepID=UPI001B121326|nr:hypothetical protein [Roseofilum sp. SID3]MBP0015339.1 hypothetical protein [Roseofilum sp. SID3]